MAVLGYFIYFGMRGDIKPMRMKEFGRTDIRTVLVTVAEYHTCSFGGISDFVF